MSDSLQSIYEQIVDEIKKHGSNFDQWYVGITNDLDRRLRVEHSVPPGSACIVKSCGTNEGARAVEYALLQLLGCKGGTGGGNTDAVYVYAYKIIPGVTDEEA